jgi:hypothetical protein
MISDAKMRAHFFSAIANLWGMSIDKEADRQVRRRWLQRNA